MLRRRRWVVEEEMGSRGEDRRRRWVVEEKIGGGDGKLR